MTTWRASASSAGTAPPTRPAAGAISANNTATRVSGRIMALVSWHLGTSSGIENTSNFVKSNAASRFEVLTEVVQGTSNRWHERGTELARRLHDPVAIAYERCDARKATAALAELRA